MQLRDTLTMMAAHLKLDAEELIRFSQEDSIGGFHTDESQRKWNVGSVWEVEGKVLYAIVRALKPEFVCEIGSYYGCSTAHIAAALEANGKGTLVSVDNRTLQPPPEAIYIPEKHVVSVQAEGAAYLAQEGERFDLVFEDADHGPDSVAAISRAAWAALNPGGVLINHDAAHFLVGEAVRSGLIHADVPFRVYSIEPSDCGLAVSVKPGQRATDEPQPVKAEEKPKRTRSKKATT
jgi:predicted O-methyltransferase YrrM